MKQRELGHTGLRVGALGLGAMHLTYPRLIPEAQAEAVLRAAAAAGVTFWDTADCYCAEPRAWHHNERVLCRILAAADLPADIVVGTKGGLIREAERFSRNGDPDDLYARIRASFEVFGGSKPLLLWQHHGPDQTPVKVSLRAARRALDEGLIRYVGVSNYSLEQLRDALEVVDVVSVQNRFHLLHREALRDGTLEFCERRGIAFLAWAPLGGRLHRQQLFAHPAVERIAAARGVSPAAVALAWLLQVSPAVIPIPGTSRPERIAEFVQGADLVLEPREIAILNGISVS